MGFGESILGLTGLENPWIAKGVAVGLVVLLLGKYLNKRRENEGSVKNGQSRETGNTWQQDIV